MYHYCAAHCCCLFFPIGCRKDNPASESTTNLQDRLQAAKLITVNSEKNGALEIVVADAAKQADAQIVIEAITEINQTSIRNAAAANAASLLQKAGKTKDAVKVAELINDTSLRNKVLAEIAKQQ